MQDRNWTPNALTALRLGEIIAQGNIRSFVNSIYFVTTFLHSPLKKVANPFGDMKVAENNFIFSPSVTYMYF